MHFVCLYFSILNALFIFVYALESSFLYRLFPARDFHIFHKRILFFLFFSTQLIIEYFSVAAQMRKYSQKKRNSQISSSLILISCFLYEIRVVLILFFIIYIELNNIVSGLSYDPIRIGAFNALIALKMHRKY